MLGARTAPEREGAGGGRHADWQPLTQQSKRWKLFQSEAKVNPHKRHITRILKRSLQVG